MLALVCVLRCYAPWSLGLSLTLDTLFYLIYYSDGHIVLPTFGRTYGRIIRNRTAITLSCDLTSFVFNAFITMYDNIIDNVFLDTDGNYMECLCMHDDYYINIPVFLFPAGEDEDWTDD